MAVVGISGVVVGSPAIGMDAAKDVVAVEAGRPHGATTDQARAIS